MLSKNKQSLIILLCFMVLSVFFILPLITHPEILFASDDFSFHMPRTLSMYNNLKAGHLIPSFDFNAFNSFGSAYNLFYPYLLNTFPIALFRLCLGSWTAAYITYYWAITLTTLLIAYYSVHLITHSKLSALLFSIIYTFSTYRVIDSFFRADLGELIVITSLPLIFCGLELLLQGKYHKWYLLTAGMTLVAYSHILSLVTVSIFIVLRLLFSLSKLSKKFFISFFIATTATLLLSAFQLISIIEQYHFQQLRSVATVNVLDKTASFASLLLSSLSNQYLSPDVISIGIMVCLLGIVIIRSTGQLMRQFNYLSINALIGFIAIFISTTLFPWYLFNRAPFNIIQFPFRFLLFANYFITFSGTILLSQKLKKLDFNVQKLSFIILLGLIMTLHIQTSTNLIQHSKLTTHPTYETIIPPNNYDYHPNVDLFKLQTIHQKMFKINNAQYQSNIVLKHTNSSFYFDYNNVTIPTTIDTPIINYKGVRLTDNGRSLTPMRSSRGTVKLTLNTKGHHHIQITYNMSPNKKIAMILSILTLILLFLYIILGNRKTNSINFNSLSLKLRA